MNAYSTCDSGGDDSSKMIDGDASEGSIMPYSTEHLS